MLILKLFFHRIKLLFIFLIKKFLYENLNVTDFKLEGCAKEIFYLFLIYS
jgi:hypothetical protein